ncbi:MAG: T9SS type A sorting domain-containing protein, partial [Fibrobacterota bacterium]
ARGEQLTFAAHTIPEGFSCSLEGNNLTLQTEASLQKPEATARITVRDPYGEEQNLAIPLNFQGDRITAEGPRLTILGEKAAPLQISFYTVQGKKIRKVIREPAQFHRISLKDFAAGTYVGRLNFGKTDTVIRLIRP